MVAMTLRIALPQIVAVTSAAEPFRKVHPYGFRMEDIEALDAALTALEEALS